MGNKSTPTREAGDHLSGDLTPKQTLFVAEYLANGLNDSAPGALIPYVEKWYGIGYAVVSTIWISNA